MASEADGIYRRTENHRAQVEYLEEQVSQALAQARDLEEPAKRWRELCGEFPPQEDEAPLPVFVARMIREGASYDGEAGVWWSSEDKPGVVRDLESQVAALSEALGEQAAGKASWQARAEGLERVIRRALSVTRCDHLDMGGEEKSRYSFTPARGVRADQAIKTMKRALSAPRPSPSRILGVVRSLYGFYMAECPELWEDIVDEALERLTPAERAAIGGGDGG